MINFMYGGLGSTFKRHQKANYEKIEQRRAQADSIHQKINYDDSAQYRRTILPVRDNRAIDEENYQLNAINCTNDIDDEFYAWECVSIMRSNGYTLDLVIKDYQAALCLLHFIHRTCYKEKKGQKPEGPECMSHYKQLKF